jgi:hypothetical protein
MTLAELKALVHDLIFDKAPTPTPFAAASLTRFVNLGMHHTYNLIQPIQRNLFVTTGTISASVPAYARLSAALPITNALGYTRPKRILDAYRTNTTPGACPVVDLTQQTLKFKGVVNPLPPIGLLGEQVFAVEPPLTESAAVITLTYEHALPDMNNDTNTPGQTGADNTGTANLIPVEYQPLIAFWAGVLALRSMRLADQAAGLYSQYIEARDVAIAATAKHEKDAGR